MKNKYIALILALPLAIFLAAAAPRAAEAETQSWTSRAS